MPPVNRTYSIDEVTTRLNCSRTSLRHWEKEKDYPGTPHRRNANYGKQPPHPDFTLQEFQYLARRSVQHRQKLLAHLIARNEPAFVYEEMQQAVLLNSFLGGDDGALDQLKGRVLIPEIAHGLIVAAAEDYEESDPIYGRICDLISESNALLDQQIYQGNDSLPPKRELGAIQTP